MEYLDEDSTPIAEQHSDRTLSILNTSRHDDRCTLLSVLAVGSWQLYGIAHKFLETKSYNDLVTLSEILLDARGDLYSNDLNTSHFKDSISYLLQLFQHAKAQVSSGRSILPSLLNLGTHIEEIESHVSTLSQLLAEKNHAMSPMNRTPRLPVSLSSSLL